MSRGCAPRATGRLPPGFPGGARGRCSSTQGRSRRRDSRLDPAAHRQRVDQGDFGVGLAIEAVDTAGERIFDLFRRLADSGEDHAGRIAASLNHPEELAGRDYVATHAGPGRSRGPVPGGVPRVPTRRAGVPAPAARRSFADHLPAQHDAVVPGHIHTGRLHEVLPIQIATQRG
jgi:hypothetical protein